MALFLFFLIIEVGFFFNSRNWETAPKRLTFVFPINIGYDRLSIDYTKFPSYIETKRGQYKS